MCPLWVVPFPGCHPGLSKLRKHAECTKANIYSFLLFECRCRVTSSLKDLLLPAYFLVI